MRNIALTTSVLAALCQPAFAWNDKGHMVVAELAYQRLTPAQRQAVRAILRQHPHWDEYLIADRPENVPEEQCAFCARRPGPIG